MSWTCLRCETHNGDSDPTCEVCDLERLFTRYELDAARNSSRIYSYRKKWTFIMLSVLAASLFVVAIILGSRLRQEREGVADLRRDLMSLEVQKAKLSEDLQQERSLRRNLAREWPVSLVDLRTSSSPQEAAVSGASSSYYSSTIRYVRFEANLINNQPEVNQVRGRLCLKYYSPAEMLITGKESSGGCSFWVDVKMSDRAWISDGWGHSKFSTYNLGRHRIELWWGDKILGRTEFFIR